MQAEKQQDGNGKGNGNSGHEDPQKGPEVTVQINDKPVSIHRGRRTVAELKVAGDVPMAHDLEQLVNGKLSPIADDGAVVIKGGEEFFSHPKDSGSS